MDPSWSEAQRAAAMRNFLYDIAKHLPKVSSPIARVFAADTVSTGVFAFDLLRSQYQILFRNAPIKKKEYVCADFLSSDNPFWNTLAVASHAKVKSVV
jgi:hypothetical protein